MNPITANLNRQYLLSILFTVIFLATTQNIAGQKIDKINAKASQFFLEEKYEKASKQYLKIIKSNTYYEDAYVQLARCYERLERYEEADRYFSQIFSKSSSVDPAYFLEYGQLLMIMGRNAEARSYFTSYNNLVETNDLRVLRYIKSIEDIDKYYIDSSFVRLTLLPVSTEGDDQNPRIYNQHLIFETNKDYYKSTPADNALYIQAVADNSQDKSEKISGTIAQQNRSFGFAIATSTGELYRSFVDEKQAPDKILLYRSFIENNGRQLSKGEQVIPEGWSENIAFPTVNSTGEILVFSSDSKKSLGGWDLFITYRGTYGYSEPIPLQGFINTQGNEKYPFLINDSMLFFASDGHGGLGGYDIYYINLKDMSTIPKNLGFPINSHYNEFGLSMNADQTVGYISSDRAEQRTLADLYSFAVNQIRAIGVITDKSTGENLKNVAVEISREDTESSQMILADNGRFKIVGDPGEVYNLTAWKDGYTIESYKVETALGKSLGLYEVDIGKFPIEPTDIPLPAPVIIEEEQPVVPTGLAVFRLQIAASRSPLSATEIKHKYKGDNDVFLFEEEGWYKYAIGEYTSYFEANRERKLCGVKDAFIAAYDNVGHKMTLNSAIEVVHSKPAKMLSEVYVEPALIEIVERRTIYFPFDLYEPSSSEMSKASGLSDALKNDMSLKAEINGHSDIQGSSEYNFGLSQARADFIRNYFIQQGIGSERISVVSYGERRLEQDCDADCTPAIHKANRRAEVILYR